MTETKKACSWNADALYAMNAACCDRRPIKYDDIAKTSKKTYDKTRNTAPEELYWKSKITAGMHLEMVTMWELDELSLCAVRGHVIVDASTVRF